MKHSYPKRKAWLRLDAHELCALICLAGKRTDLSAASKRDVARALPELQRALTNAARVRRIRKRRRRARRRRR